MGTHTELKKMMKYQVPETKDSEDLWEFRVAGNNDNLFRKQLLRRIHSNGFHPLQESICRFPGRENSDWLSLVMYSPYHTIQAKGRAGLSQLIPPRLHIMKKGCHRRGEWIQSRRKITNSPSLFQALNTCSMCSVLYRCGWKQRLRVITQVYGKLLWIMAMCVGHPSWEKTLNISTTHRIHGSEL